MYLKEWAAPVLHLTPSLSAYPGVLSGLCGESCTGREGRLALSGAAQIAAADGVCCGSLGAGKMM